MRKRKSSRKLITIFSLPKEMTNIGCKFSFLEFCKYMIFGLLIFGLASYLFKLQPIYFIAVEVCFVILIPEFTYDAYKTKYEKRRFDDIERYVDNVLSAFARSKKILPALINTSKQYPDGSHIKECIQLAIDYINAGEIENEIDYSDPEKREIAGNIYKQAFRPIEKEYKCNKILDTHEFLINAEKIGGDITLSVDLLLKDKQNWYENIIILQQQKNKKYKEIIASAVMCTLLCVAFIVFEGSLPEKLQLTKNIVQQLSCAALLIGMQFIVKSGSSKMVTNWLDLEKGDPDRQIINNYNYLLNFKNNLKKERIESCIFASPFLIAVLPLLYFHHKWFAAISGVIGIAMLFQHKLNYIISYNVALKNLRVAFPKWLLSLILLLQNNTVQNAIQKSREGAPAILRDELEKLQERIQANPSQIEGYNDFFKIFQEKNDIREINKSMQVLYSISQTGSTNGQESLNNLVASIYTFQKISDEITNEDILIDMNLTFKAPFALGAFKLLCDAALFLCVALPAFAR